MTGGRGGGRGREGVSVEICVVGGGCCACVDGLEISSTSSSVSLALSSSLSTPSFSLSGDIVQLLVCCGCVDSGASLTSSTASCVQS